MPTPLPSGLLPEMLQDEMDLGYFAHFRNVASVNTYYISHGQNYHGNLLELFSEAPPHEDDTSSNDGSKAQALDDELIVKAFQNPMRDEVNFTFEGKYQDCDKVHINFFDVLGRRIHSEMLTSISPRIRIDNGLFPAGIVSYIAMINGKKCHHGKLVKLQ